MIELLTVISIIAILATLLLTALVSAKARSRQAACLNNLRQIGLGFTGFALDHEGKYPMDVPERLGGSSEYDSSRLITNTPFSRDFHHFLTLSNEVPNVKVMVCPADRKRRPAENYRTFTNENLSYWANTRAIPHATLASLAGDWNAFNARGHSNDWEQINFGSEVHVRKGSVLFADGRVEITRSLALQSTPSADIAVTSPPTPTTPPAGAGPGARPQPNAPTTTPPPAPATPPTANPPPGNSQTPTAPPTRNTQPTPGPTAQPPSTNNLKQGNFSGSTEIRGPRSYRRKGNLGPGAEAAPKRQRIDPTTPSIPGPEAPAEEAEPWDTPGFRLFKFLAIASYLFSLLLAIIALLVLYLRSRFAQREQERASAINLD